VRLALKVGMQNDGDFVDEILLYQEYDLVLFEYHHGVRRSCITLNSR
jgi:hypothetical protein